MGGPPNNPNNSQQIRQRIPPHCCYRRGSWGLASRSMAAEPVRRALNPGLASVHDSPIHRAELPPKPVPDIVHCHHHLPQRLVLWRPLYISHCPRLLAYDENGYQFWTITRSYPALNFTPRPQCCLFPLNVWITSYPFSY